MKRELFQQALAKIPGVVAEIALWNGITTPKYSLVVRKYTASGVWFEQSQWLIDEGDLFMDIERGRSRSDCEVEITDSMVRIKRTLRSGEYYIAEYTPTVSSGEKGGESGR